jgi:hypothetical protein
MLAALVRTLEYEIVKLHGMMLLETRQVLGWKGSVTGEDPIGTEATMNKRYVWDLMGGLIDVDARDDLMTFGRAIMRIWSERIALRFPDMPVLFYLGGSESVILRFHVRRSGLPDWIELSEGDFLTESKLEVYELRHGQLLRMR